MNSNATRSPGAVTSAPLGRVAGWCYDHRWRVLVIWILAVIAVIGVAQSFGSRFNDNFTGGNAPSQQAANLLAARFPRQSGDTADVVLHSAAGPLTSPAGAAVIGKLTDALRPLATVTAVRSPLAADGRDQLSRDQRTGFIVVQFNAVAADLPGSAVSRVVTVARSFARRGLQVAVGGAPVENVVSAAPGSSEGFGITAAVIIMLLAFGSVVAMGLPIITALVGVGLGVGVSRRRADPSDKANVNLQLSMNQCPVGATQPQFTPARTTPLKADPEPKRPDTSDRSRVVSANLHYQRATVGCP